MKGVFLIFSFLVFVTLTLQVNASIALSSLPTTSADGKYIYIAYVLDSSVPAGVKPENYYTKLLTPILGSEKAAKNATVYSFHTIKGFAAWLTPIQASILQKQDGVLQVVESQTLQLHAGPGKMQV